MQTSAGHTQQWISWSGAGIRSRLRGGGRVGWVFLHVVPWLNVAVVAALAAVLSRQLTIAPGVQFELPDAPFTEGARSGAGLVIFQTTDANPRTLAFFDDVRYIVGTEDEANLSGEIAKYARRIGGGQILLLADENVRHGDVMHIVDLVRDAGVKRVNVAVKPK
ncbi:MAG: hypothetical protein IJQ73_03790 [Kiritimatiellae bacterium]|nr:hypothetical protein [Kiritimatiellia bacterium]